MSININILNYLSEFKAAEYKLFLRKQQSMIFSSNWILTRSQDQRDMVGCIFFELINAFDAVKTRKDYLNVIFDYYTAEQVVEFLKGIKKGFLMNDSYMEYAEEFKAKQLATFAELIKAFSTIES